MGGRKSENEEGTGRIYCGCDRSQYDNWLWVWCENRDSGKHTEAETTAAEEKETTAAETAQDTEKRKERILTVSGNGDFGFPSVYTISPKGQGYMTLSYIFDTLMWKDESGLIPYLAEDYSVSEDGLTYTFQLRKGVSFTDGTPFTAEDVKFTFDYMKEHPYKWVSVSMVEGSVRCGRAYGGN